MVDSAVRDKYVVMVVHINIIVSNVDFLIVGPDHSDVDFYLTNN